VIILGLLSAWSSTCDGLLIYLEKIQSIMLHNCLFSHPVIFIYRVVVLSCLSTEWIRFCGRRWPSCWWFGKYWL